jgi:ubiquitin-like 1-activating enzyme E1 B
MVLTISVFSTDRLAKRLQEGEEVISFDKDDDDTLDFVTAASNLRSAAYGIEGKTRWEVKGKRCRLYQAELQMNFRTEMAGNIIPAIATTNAIVAGLIVLQALHLLRKSYNTMKNVHLQFKPWVPLSTVNICPPNTSCAVCGDTYVKVLCDPSRVTLIEVVEGILGDGNGPNGGTGPREVSVYEDKRVLSDPDWDDNNEKTLASLNVSRGKFLTIVDEDDGWGTLSLALGVLP